MNDGSWITFKMLPVKKNDFAASVGSSAKPRAASCAATKALVVLMLMSRLNASSEIENGSLGGENVTAPATDTISSRSTGKFPQFTLTIVDDYARRTQLLLHSRERIDDFTRVGEVTCDVQLVIRAISFLQRSRCECDLIALRSKCLRDSLANIGSSAEDEDNWRCGRHCFRCMSLSCADLGMVYQPTGSSKPYILMP
jgi:hypothetical protein